MSASRLNGVIRAWESGKPAFASFASADRTTAIAFSTSPYDGLVFEMEHNPWDPNALQDALQYLLNRAHNAKADVWPLDPAGEIVVMLMIEDTPGIRNLRDMLKNVPGIGGVLIGEGD